MNQKISSDLIKDALSFIPANLPRDDWAKVLAAIKSEFDNDEGFSLAESWSQTADSYNAKSLRDTWKSLKATGGVKIGTLFFMAQQNGFVLPDPNKGSTEPDPATVARLASERAAKQQADQAQTQAGYDRAASEAALLWQVASETGESPYLTRKGVEPYGVRFGPDGCVLVPMRDERGVLWNVQRIFPSKRGNTDKLYLGGGRKTGLWHWCGSPINEPVLLIGEGYSTCASIFKTIGRPVAVAFDAGNLIHVAKALRALHPDALIALCGDNDLKTLAEKGFNPGRDKATAAAKAVNGIAVFPETLSEGANVDFNDLHQACGDDAIARIVNGAIDAWQPSAVTTQSTQAPEPADTTKTQPKGPNAEPDAPKIKRDFDTFTVNESGVWFNGFDPTTGKRKPPEWICSPVYVDALTRDQEGGAWGYYLRFADPLGHQKNWAMPARMLSADGGEYRAILLNMGLRIATTPKLRNLLTQYLQSRNPKEFASCTDRIGWHRRAFVLPRETIGDDAERIVFQSDSAVENTFRSKGTPDQWREHVGALCVGNSRMVFAVACAFAGPLLRPAGMESGGFHYRGDSSNGKTTALKLAASVYGGTNYLQRWRATDNALEAIAAQHSDCLLILDELAQIDPRTAGECAYMLANEQGKARASRTGTPRARQAWRLLFLSAGELGLADHMAEGMKRTRTGQEVRMADIPSDAGAGLGAFENLHGATCGAAFAKQITNRAQAFYGATGRAWLQHLTASADKLKASIREASNGLAARMIPENASGQVERVGARFVLVGAAGELATKAGLTGWPVGESERAATTCFNAWLAARGGIGNGEVVAMLRAVRRFLETHGEGRFAMWHRGADDHAPKTLQRAGVRRMVNEDGQPIQTNSQFGAEFGDRMPASSGEKVSFEYFVLAETFKTEICQGFDSKAVAKVLLDHDCLMPDTGRPYDCKRNLPGIGKAWCYRIPPAIFSLDIN